MVDNNKMQMILSWFFLVMITTPWLVMAAANCNVSYEAIIEVH